MATKKSAGKSKLKAGEAGSGGAGRRPVGKEKPRHKPKTASEKHIEMRKQQGQARAEAKSKTYAGGLTAKAVNADDTLSATERKRIIAVINKNKKKNKPKGGEG